MLKYINNSTGEELPFLNLTCTLDVFKEVYQALYTFFSSAKVLLFSRFLFLFAGFY